MKRRYQFILWILVTILLFLYGATGGPSQWRLVKELMSLSLGLEVEGGVAEGAGLLLFFLMGVWPLLMLLLIWPARRAWRPSPLPFLLLSFIAGAYALLPWFILRRNGEGSGGVGKSIGIRVGAVLVLLLSLAAAAVSAGRIDLDLFLRSWLRFPFYQVMSLDFLIFWLLFALEAYRLSRRPVALTLAPVFGSALLLLVSPDGGDGE